MADDFEGSSPEEERWYALFVALRHEKSVAAQLGQKNLQTFLPLYSVGRLWGQRRAEVRLPLFPGYLFCRFDIARHRVQVLRTFGVLRIVGTGHSATPVDDAELTAIERVVSAGVVAEPWPYLQAGESVRIRSGALAGMEGVLVKSKGQCRLVVSVSLLQRSVAVEIERDCVGAATAAGLRRKAPCASEPLPTAPAFRQCDVGS